MQHPPLVSACHALLSGWGVGIAQWLGLWTCDPGHSGKNAGGRLQLNMHTLYICGFA